MFKVVPQKIYRLHDGSLGTEYEAVREAIQTLEVQRLHLDEKIEILRLRLDLAEGHPFQHHRYFNLRQSQSSYYFCVLQAA